MKKCVFAFFLSAFLSGMLSFAFADPDNELLQDSQGSKDQCNGYCFFVLKPAFDNFVEQKQRANANHEQNVKVISSLQNQLEILEVQIQNKIELITQKDEQIRDKISLITQKDEQIRDKNELITMNNNENQVQSEQIKRNEDEINSLRNEIKSISAELTTTKQRLSALTQAEWCPLVDRKGIFKMHIRGVNVFEAPCTKDGWMIIQKRIDGGVDFNRTWEDYKNGFGDLHGDFFIGLEKLHLITQAKSFELNIELGDVNGTTSYAHYDNFEIGSEKESYYLKSIGTYSGTGGDSLSYHERMKFSTFDRDNDKSLESCAEALSGGWWFNNCGYSSLNGKYFKDGKAEEKNGIYWGHSYNFDYTISLTSAQMMIKPKLLGEE